MPEIRNKQTVLSSNRLPIIAERSDSCVGGRLTIQLRNRAINTAKPPNQASNTGSRRRIFCIHATARSPARVDAQVAIRMGRNTMAGSGAPCCARYKKMVTGSKVTAEVLSTRNRICASEAVSLSGLRLCRSCMAFSPMGVAALSSPSMLAARFMVMEPMAGCPAGTSGIRRVNSGVTARDNMPIRPLCSAMRNKPSHSAISPIRPMAISTDSEAISNMLAMTSLKTSGFWPVNHCQSAARKPSRKKAVQIILSMAARLSRQTH